MLQTLSVLAGLMGLAAIPAGIWLLNASQLPSWMKGLWKYPLGEHVTPTVIHLQGWASGLVGLAALIAAVIVWLPRGPAVLSGLLATFLVGAATFAWVWSVALSRSK